MLGYNHAATGLALGLATLPVAPASTPGGQAAWVLGLGGAALLPDLDTETSTAARMWGPLTQAPAGVIGTVAGGHRQGTHDAILAPLAAALLATVAVLHPLALGALLALLVGLAVRGLCLTTGSSLGNLANLAVSVGAAWWLVASGASELEALPLVLAGGVLVHIAGDALTTEGIPIPVAWIAGQRQRIGLRLFATGHLIEKVLVGPALSVAVVVLLAHHLHITSVDSAVQVARALATTSIAHLSGLAAEVFAAL